jgi:hypothetical protein
MRDWTGSSITDGLGYDRYGLQIALRIPKILQGVGAQTCSDSNAFRIALEPVPHGYGYTHLQPNGYERQDCVEFVNFRAKKRTDRLRTRLRKEA